MTKVANHKSLLFALAISSVAGLTYVSGLSSPFAAEDFNTIFLSSLDFKVLWGNLLSRFRFHPLPFFLTWSIYRISGTRPELYHLSTLLLHIACSLLVFQLTYLLTKQSKAALVAGLVFAPYPRHHHAVLWLACNHIIVQAFFGLLALVTFGMFLRKNRVGYQVVTVLCTAAAVLANEIGLLLFPLLFLLEIAMKQPSLSECLLHLRNPRTYQKYLPFLVVLGIAFGLTFGGQRTIKLSTTVHETYETVYHLRGLGLNEIRRFVAFLVYLVLPQVPIRGLDVTPITLVIATLTLGGLLLLLLKGSPAVRFFVVWILVSPIPFVLFIPWESDRYFYFPAVGLCCLAGTLSWRLYDKIRARQSACIRVMGLILLTIYLLSSFIIASQRIREWRKAGEMAQDLIRQVTELHPSLPSGSKLFFVDPPSQHGQAYVFLGGGLGSAIRLAYGPQIENLEVYQTHDPIISSLLRSRGTEGGVLHVYVFLYESGTLLDKSKAINDLDELRKVIWYP